jgi:hypothetical protein
MASGSPGINFSGFLLLIFTLSLSAFCFPNKPNALRSVVGTTSASAATTGTICLLTRRTRGKIILRSFGRRTLPPLLLT